MIRAGGKFRSIPKGSRVALFVAQWSWASAKLGRPIITADYIRYWHEPERTVYGHLRQFRELFPEYATPQPIAELVAAESGAAGSAEALMTAAVLL